MKDDRTRPATFEDVKNLIQALNETGVEYFLIGGYALYAHGYHRATEDIDILIPATRQAGELVKQALMKLPDRVAKDIDVAWIEQGEAVRVADEFVVDLLMNASGQTYEKLEPFREVIEVEGIPVSTLDLEGLIKTKQSAGENDILDREILQRALELSRQRK